MVTKKKQSKTVRVKPRDKKMRVAAPNKTRLVISCTNDEKIYLKMLAAKNKMTMGEYLLSFARKEMPKCGSHHCKRSHTPNKETAKVLRETDRGENLLEYETIEEFWDDLGFSQHA